MKSYWPIATKSLLTFIGSISCVSSFIVVAPSRAGVVPTFRHPVNEEHKPKFNFIGSCHPSAQQHSANNISTSSTSSLHMANTDGTREGAYILGFVLVICVWLFSIPVEFRRARICTEEEYQSNPQKDCVTFDLWKSGIVEYYSNGGGVQFDFSIEGRDVAPPKQYL